MSESDFCEADRTTPVLRKHKYLHWQFDLFNGDVSLGSSWLLTVAQTFIIVDDPDSIEKYYSFGVF